MRSLPRPAILENLRILTDRSADVVYDRSLHNLKTRPMIIPPQLTASQRRDAVMDHYQSIRTNILLAWVLTNVRFLLCAVDEPAVLTPLLCRRFWSRPS